MGPQFTMSSPTPHVNSLQDPRVRTVVRELVRMLVTTLRAVGPEAGAMTFALRSRRMAPTA